MDVWNEAPSGRQADAGESLRLASFLRSEREDILRDWEDADRQALEPPGDRLSQSDLRDHIPALLDRIAEVADRHAGSEDETREPLPSDDPREHARHRLAMQFSLRELTREYALLRKIILKRLAPRVGELDFGELVLLNEALDQAVILSVDEYAKGAAEALESEKEHLQEILDQMPAAVFVVEAPSGRVVYSNKMTPVPLKTSTHWKRMSDFGFKVYDAASSPLSPEDTPVASVLRTGRAVEQQELQILRADNTCGTYAVSATPIRDKHGGHFVVATAVDISAQKRTEAELRKRVETENQFMGIMSHDLRSPVTAIIMGAATALRRNDLPQGLRPLLQRLLNSGSRINRMIRDLLDLTMIRFGTGLPVKPANVDVHEMTRQILEEIRLANPDRLIQHEEVGPGACRLDPDRGAEVITNLVGNALQYAREGTPVRVQTGGDESRVIIRVQNEGPPIPGNILPHIFEPMTRGARGKDSTSRSVGLGLFIVKHIADAHGGDVEVMSTEDRGTTFTVSLPRST